MIRAITEFVSRRVVLKRRLPGCFENSPLYVTPGSALSYWKRDLNESSALLLDVARLHLEPGQVVWDIGANVGVFSFAAASLVGGSGRVVSVEPDAWLVRLLQKSASLSENRCKNIDIFPAAITDHVEVVQLHVAKRGRATNFISGSSGSSQTGGIRFSQSVPGVSLDWMLDRYPAPHFVKIDVEGSEARVLAGATRLLADRRPVVCCEVAREHSREVAAILRQNNYLLYDLDSGKPISDNTLSAAWNTLAHPVSY